MPAIKYFRYQTKNACKKNKTVVLHVTNVRQFKLVNENELG